MIKGYKFGKIKVNGKNYESDLYIETYSNKADKIEVIERNFDSSENKIKKEEIEKLIADNPDVIVIGTGFMDGLRVDNNLIETLEEKGIKIVIENTRRAVINFNNFVSSGNTKVKGIFHLT